jgi:hemerythrin-like domain-containing protein
MESQKRHPALIPLSHDHHHGLMAAVRLKRGDTAFAETADMADSIRLLWESELEPHFRQEEEQLFAYPGYPEPIPGMIDRVIREHRQLRELIDRCTADPAIETVKELGGLLESHIRFEERELFPLMQESLPAEELARIGREIEGGKRVR